MFDQSCTGTSFRLVHTAQVNYAETGQMATDLERLQNPSDGYMDGVHALRDTHGADLVQLWIEDDSQAEVPGFGTISVCGIAYAGIPDINEAYGFSVKRRPCEALTMAHELGH